MSSNVERNADRFGERADRPVAFGYDDKRSRCSRDLMVALALCLFVSLVFFQTVFLGKPISKACMIAEWDSVFSQYHTGRSMLMDPSLVQLMIPYYFHVARLWHHLELPLWNSLSGLGCPLLADPQSLALSPLHIPLALFPNMRTYNLTLVMESMISAVGGFLLARRLGLPRSYAVFAALSFTLCPYILHYQELIGQGYILLPILMWSFARLGLDPSIANGIIAGALSAVMLLSGHPELSFFCIVFATLLAVLLHFTPGIPGIPGSAPEQHSAFGGSVLAAESLPVTGPEANDREAANLSAASGRTAPEACRQGIPRAMALAIAVILAAVTAFCLSAPMLLPFLEYLLNSDSYKFGMSAPSRIAWQGILLNLMQPGFRGASPYLGILALPAVPFCFAPNATRQERRTALSLAVVALIALSISAKLWPVSALLSLKSLSVIIVNYCFPIFLLSLSMLQALGMKRILEGYSPQSDRDPPFRIYLFGLFCALTAFSVLIPHIVQYCGWPTRLGNFDRTLPDMSFSSSLIAPSLAIALSIPVLLVASLKGKGWLPPALRSAVLACGIVSQLLVARNSMPVQAQFDYPETALTKALKATEGRLLGVGSHLLKPDTNVVYGLADLRSHNPLFPKRYLDFVKAAGASLDQFNQTFSHDLSPLLRFASVSQVIAQEPVREWREPKPVRPKPVRPFSPIQFEEGVSVSDLAWEYDTPAQACFGEFNIEVNRDDNGKFGFCILALDQDHRVAWFGDRQPLVKTKKKTKKPEAAALSNKLQFRESFAAPFVVQAGKGSGSRDDGRTTVGIQIYRTADLALLNTVNNSKTATAVATLAEFSTADHNVQSQSASDRPEKIVSSDQPPSHPNPWRRVMKAGDIFIMRSSEALPPAYMAYNVKQAGSPEAALTLMQDRSFDPKNDLIVEGRKDSPSKAIRGSTPSSGTSSVHINRRKNSEIEVTVDSKKAGFLVLTDIFYPGWIAEVDGRETTILRANYLFRAVPVEQGSHVVRFLYRPWSVIAGALLAFGAVLIVALLFICRRILATRAQLKSSA